MPRRPAHILIVLDAGSKHQPALERGAWLAERTGATVELFVCEYDQDLSASRLFDAVELECARRRRLAAQRRALEGYAKPLAARGIRVSIDVRWDHPLDAGIVRKADEAKADLVLKASRYHAELGRSLFSAADWSLMAACPVNLWLAKPRALARMPTILAAIDPRHCTRERAPGDKRATRPSLEDTAVPRSLDERVLRSAIELEDSIDGAVHVFHGFDVSSALAVSADALTSPISAPVRDLKAALMREHRDAVLALTDRHALDRERVHVHEGPIRQQLIAAARETNADVLAIAAVSRRGLPRKFVGSTAEHVLEEVPCDLLIVAP